MMKKILSYGVDFTLRPRSATRALMREMERVKLGVGSTVLFALMYSYAALMLHYAGIKPAIKPLLPIKKDRYYLWQSFFTLPWSVTEWYIGLLAVHGICGRQMPHTTLSDLVGPFSFASIVPWLYLAWFPETTIIPARGGDDPPWTPSVDAARQYAAALWTAVLVAVVVKEVYGVSWLRAILAGGARSMILFAMFLPFMR